MLHKWSFMISINGLLMDILSLEVKQGIIGIKQIERERGFYNKAT